MTQLTLPGRRSVTDSGLSSLSRLTLLTELDLTDYTQVTDQGVAQLASMRRSSTCSHLLTVLAALVVTAALSPQVEEAVA